MDTSLGPFNFRTSDIWGRMILYCGGGGGGRSPVHCRMFSNIPGFYPLNIKSILHPAGTNQNRLQALPNVPHGSNIIPG